MSCHFAAEIANWVVQENLKFEQRSVLQFNWVLVHRILSPIQVALFMVHAWPSHCDCLAMVNTVNSIKHELMVSLPSFTFGTIQSEKHDQSTPPCVVLTVSGETWLSK